MSTGRRISFSSSGKTPSSARIPKKPSQRLALEDSILKASQGNLNIPTQATKSAVGFQDAKKTAHKDSVKKHKQAWESPPNTPLLPKHHKPSVQGRSEKV